MTEAARIEIAGPPATEPVAPPRSDGGLRATAFLMIGLTLGPAGLAVVTDRLLALIDPFIPFALATIGVLGGIDLRARWTARAVGADTLRAGAVVIIVALTVRLALWMVRTDTTSDWWASIVAGLCACGAGPLLSDRRLHRDTSEAERRRLGPVLAVAAASLLLATAGHHHTVQAGSLLFAAAIGTSVLLAIAGTLLLATSSAAAEHRVFAVAIALLLGGVADLLSAVGLLSGMCAGTVWRSARSGTRETFLPILAGVQPVFVVIVLLVAGAHTQVTIATTAGAIGYLLSRTVGHRIAPPIAVRRAERSKADASAVTSFNPYAIALALGMTRGDLPGAATILGIVVLATAGSQVVRWRYGGGEA